MKKLEFVSIKCVRTIYTSVFCVDKLQRSIRLGGDCLISSENSLQRGEALRRLVKLPDGLIGQLRSLSVESTKVNRFGNP